MYSLKTIHFNEIPNCIKEKTISKGKFVNHIGYTENDFGKTFYIKEGYELLGYLLVEGDEKAILTVKLPLNQLPYLFELPVVTSVIEEEIHHYKQRKGIKK